MTRRETDESAKTSASGTKERFVLGRRTRARRSADGGVRVIR